MNTTLKICRLQLLILFCSPVSWLVLFIFALYSGILFTDQVDILTSSYRVYPEGMDFLTGKVFLGWGWNQLPSGFIYKLFQGLMIFIPVLSMGLISSETNRGTMPLLLSSPIKIRAVVLGKYLALLVFNLSLPAVLLLIALGASQFINHIDWGLIFSFITALYLLAACYAAVGLFMSSITRYPVLACILTLALLFLLDYLGGLAQDVPVIKDLFYWLSIRRHSMNALKGYWVSEDLLYFVIISAWFVFFTIHKMTADRCSGRRKIKVFARVFGALILSITFIYLMTQPALKGFLDLTETRIHTMHPAGLKIMGQLDQDSLTFIARQNVINARKLLPENQLAYKKENYNQYERFMPQAQFDFKLYRGPLFGGGDPFWQSPRKAESWQKKAERTIQYKGLNTSKIIAFDSLNIEEQKWIKACASFSYSPLKEFVYAGKQSFIIGTSRDDRGPMEDADDFTALKQFIVPYPRISILQGNQERSITRKWERDWSRVFTNNEHRSSVRNLGFYVRPVNLNKAPLPKHTDILVIADPLTAYSPSVVEKINAYIDQGGNALIAIEEKNKQNIAPILSYLGVTIEGLVMSNRQPASSNFTLGKFNEEVPDLLKGFGQKPVNMLGAAALHSAPNSPFTAYPFTKTDKNFTWLANDPKKVRQSFTTSLSLQRNQKGRLQKIMIMADADGMANKEILKSRENPSLPNVRMYKNILRWLSDGAYPLVVKPVKGSDDSLSVSNEKISLFRWIYVGGIPGLIFILGALTSIRRKRK